METVAQNKGDYVKNLVEVSKFHKIYAQYMIEHKLPYDDRFHPSQGMSYMTHVINSFLPIFLSIVVIFITSAMYCSSMIDTMDIHNLIPMHRLKKQGIRLLVGGISGLGTVIFIIILSILCGSIGNSFGNFDSPILSYTLQGADKYIPFRSIFPQLLLLICLSILFLVNVTSILSVFTKKNITCMLYALAIIVGGMWIVTKIEPIFPISHMIPMTYLQSLNVISGELMATIHNTKVNFLNGVIVLGLSNVLLFILYDLITKSRFKRVLQ